MGTGAVDPLEFVAAAGDGDHEYACVRCGEVAGEEG